MKTIYNMKKKRENSNRYTKMSVVALLLHDCNTHISVKLPDKTGEVVVLEIARKNDPSKLHRVPDDEALSRSPPRNDGVQRSIVHQIESLGQKWRHGCPMKRLQRLRHCHYGIWV